MLPIEPIEKTASECGIPLTERMRAQLRSYAALLLEWNERMNLTAITDPAEMAVKHFADSLTVLKVARFPQNAKLLDVGSGAGFPGIPLKILRPDLDLTLLDSHSKRTQFLRAAAQAVEIKLETLTARAEETGRRPAYREKWEFVTARAVAALPVLCELCLPLTQPGGRFIAMKGPGGEQEAQEAAQAMRLLGAALERVESIQLPDGSGRTLILIQKISQTPTKYPRLFGKIRKSPL